MATIRAKGTRRGSPLELSCTDDDGTLRFTSSGKHALRPAELEALAEIPPGLANGYYPPPSSMLAALAVFYSLLAERDRATVEIDGDIGSIPHDDNPDTVY